MKHHLNTLFVMTPGAYLAKDGESVVVRIEREVRLRMPLINLGAIVTFGAVGCSPALMGACGEKGVAISFLSRSGRFLARVAGFTPGNVLLRREQYRRADEEPAAVAVARAMILAKTINMRHVLLRAAREGAAPDPLRTSAERIANMLDEIRAAHDLDRLRGLEGDASHCYFSVFNHMLGGACRGDGFEFRTRSRRPPLDRVNALLSFLYTMLTLDARSACESVGLDPQVGFLHRDRPGRPGLALDLIEEFRAPLADRLAITLINRQQVRAEGFAVAESGAVTMTADTRKVVLAEYQRRKQEPIVHGFLDEKTTVGLLIHLQARLLARHLRGDLDAYPPFVWK